MTKFKSELTPQLSSITKKVAWFNIIIQLAFPISATIPVNVFADGNIQENQLINKENTYQVKEGDTPESIAKQFNIKLFELIEINPDYVSLVGNLKIKTGITLNIPSKSLLTKKWLNNNNQDNPIPSTDGQELAQIIVDNSSLLNKETDATQYAISRVSSKANQQIEQWLNQFGHARVSLSTDKDFTLENSSADLLIPIYDQEKNLVFTQTSYHRKDSRSQFNQGIGYRHFTDKFMVGLNAFYDYDLSRYHSRFGVGAEVWRDYFKLSMNHYHRLSNWRTSDDVMDYNERPANGWDIRTEGYLPAYPQLGAKLIFEQYYGKEVGLFGKDNRQENPHAYTAGLTYTPVPLLTFGAERRFGLNDNGDNRLDISLQYHLGESISSQLNPDNVRAMRLMSGSRYDFVDRNNDIVLEYKKKTLVFLSMAPSLSGYANEEKDLNVYVHAKYPVKNIEWSASRLITNGGKINHNGGFNYSVILPRHVTGTEQQNSYTISAIAIDEQGNRSDPVQSKIIVSQSAINTQNSQFTPKISQLAADGHSTQSLLLTVLDNDKLPVDINLKELSLNSSSDNAISTSRISAFTRLDAGKYQLTITAGSSPETVTLTPKFRDDTFNSAKVVFIADDITAHIAKGELTVVKDNAPADGKSQNKIQAIVTDLNHNPIPHYPVSFSADNGATIMQQGETDAQGKIIVPITNTLQGQTNIEVTVKDIAYAAKVNFIADVHTAKLETFTITPYRSFANNSDEKTLAFKVLDANKNPVPDITIQLTADNKAQLKQTTLTTDKQGLASTTMTSKISGIVTVSAEVNNVVSQEKTQFIADMSNGKITSITASAPPYIADGKTPVTYTAVVKDNNNNPLINAKIIWSTDGDPNSVKIDDMSVTDDQGIATTQITSTKELDVIVTASISNDTVDAAPIHFTADIQQALFASLTIDKNQITADTKDSALLTAVITDNLGNPLSDMSVQWQGSQGVVFSAPQTRTDKQGQTQTRITTNQAGLTTINAKLANGKTAQVTLMAVADHNSATVTITPLNGKISAIADDSDTLTFTAHVVDSHHNPLMQHPVFWQATHNTLSKNLVKTDNNGDVNIELKGTQALPTTLTATLLNKQQASLDVIFTPGNAASAHSSMILNPQSIIADGKSVSTATITLKDKFDNPVPQQAKTLLLTGDNNTIQFSSIKEIAKGIYQLNISGKQEGISTISAQYQQSNTKFTLTQPLGFVADTQNAVIKSVTVIKPYEVIANGHDKVTLRAEIVDKQGNPSMANVAVGWISPLGTFSSPLSKTNAQGIAETTISSTQAGVTQVSALLDSQQSLDADHIITFNTDVISADQSQLSLTPDSIVSTVTKATLTLTLKDKNGNLLKGLASKINARYSTDLTFTISPFTETDKGIYQAQIGAIKAGQTVISAEVNAVTLTQTAPLTVLPNGQTAKVSKFVISDRTPHAGDTITYDAYLIDANDNPIIAGMPVTWTTNKDSLLATPLTFTDSKGVTQAKLTRDPAGIAKVSVVLSTGTYPADDVNFIADDVDENRSEIGLLPSSIIANGKDSAVLSLTVRDKGGNILPDQTVEGISANPTLQFSTAKQVSPGHYEITVTGTQSGTTQLTVKVNGVEFKKQKTLQLRADPATWQVKAVDVDRTTIIAGDKGVNYQATIVDANDNILPNVIVSWKLQGLADDYDFSTYTDAKGVARTKVTSHVAGTLKMSAYLDLNNHKPIHDVVVTPADIDANKSTFSSSRQSIGGNDKDSALLSVKLIDKYDNAIEGKKVSITATSGTPHFSDNPLKPVGNGEYQTNLTSNVKTDIVLTANSEGITLAKPITIKVTIPKPEIIFDKPIQQETYASAPINALGYTGIPNNINVMWSSSDPSVASIDALNGEVSMKKAGTAIITLQTAGNDQYQPSQSSYPLVIEKAKPNLKLTSPLSIQSTWNDGVTYNVSVTFDNADAKNIPLNYVSDDQHVMTIDTQGTITEVKPGKTKIHINSDATEQFLADTVTVDYQQDKGTLSIQFASKNMILYENDTNIKVQQPISPLPKEAQGVWSAKDPSIVSIKEDGTIIKVSSGSTEITLTSKENDYFYESEGYYFVNVRKVPHVTINYVSRRVDNNNKAQIIPNTNTPISWTPVYEDDALTFSWIPPKTSGMEYAVNFELWDGNKKTSKIFEYPANAIASGNTVTTRLTMEKNSLQSTDLKIKVIVFDLADNNKEYPTFYPLNVKAISPKYMDFTLAGKILFIETSNNGTQTSSCRTLPTDTMTHVMASPVTSLGLYSEKLLYPIAVSHKLINIQGDASRSEVDYHDEYVYNTSTQNNSFNNTFPSLAMKEDCFQPLAGDPDSGSATLITNITINGVTKEYQQTVQWDGTGDPNKNKVSTIYNKAVN
ncbi:Ig-like domain-containing protein [Proteus sp. fly-1008]|uniref:Ig-like domain-containing protein n=1 Tax=Proteus sp. fly-1008 TaxID=3136672 RepID=UPI0032DB0ED2